MQKYTLLTAMFLAAGLMAGARTLSPSQALSRALSDQNVSQSALQRAPRVAAPVITVTGGEEAEPAVYVFKGDSSIGGYLIVSASDVAVPVLGYSDNGTFDPADIPPQMKWWLDEYAAAIASAEAAGASEWKAPSRSERTPVGPLCSTRWNQGEPYNNDCPEYETDKKSVTGCTATAMAQIMKYHNYPEKGTGTTSYTWHKPNGDTQTLEMNLNVPLDWANMLDSYSGSYTAEQAAAVANLMKACGYSIFMSYGPSSGAYPISAAAALVKNYGYDKWTSIAYRATYTTQAWEDAMYDNLVECGPVLMSGANSDSGHAFVCDGYSTDGYFHINWGWGGWSDGYFQLSALDPSQQGIGGTNAGYNTGQDAVFGIRKPVESHTAIRPGISSTTPMKCAKINSSQAQITGSFLSSTSLSDFSAGLGVRITDTSGKEIASSCTEYVNYQTAGGYFYINYNFPISIIPQGTSHIYPAFKYEGKVYDITPPASQMPYFIATRSGSSITFQDVSMGAFSVTNVELTTPMYAGRDFTIKADGVWTGSESVYLEVMPLILDSSLNLKGIGNTLGVNFNADSELSPFSYDGQWLDPDTRDKITLEPGDYYCTFVYYNGSNYQQLCDNYPVTVGADPGEGFITASDPAIFNVNDVDPHALTFSCGIYCSSGYYDNGIYAYVYDYDGGTFEGITGVFIPLTIWAGERKVITPTINIGDLTPHHVYYIGLYGNSDWLTYVVPFTVGDYTGIEGVRTDAPGISPNPAADFTTVTAAADIKGIQVVGMTGSPAAVGTAVSGNTATLDVSTLPKGIYIVVVTTEAGISTAKLVKN